MFSTLDTIVAVVTPPGRGGIGVVRISGSQARAIAAAMLRPAGLEPRRATLTRVVGPDGRPLDEVVVTLFPSPHSYTTEDVVEVSAHGSPALLRAIVNAAVAAGARLAEPGEFTFRAFLHGRLDLVQAEAVADLVDAVTPLQARVAFDQLDGTLTGAIGRLDEELFDLAARLEASLDFPEEGYHFVDAADARATVVRVGDGVEALLASAGRGRLIREGCRVAILGKPNVGKSTLFNWLVGSDRAIVAETPGTTRDLVTETVDFEGLRLGLIDTAGQRAGTDAVEREGISRARAAAGVADLALVVLDVSSPLDADDHEVLAATAGALRVVVWNKADLGTAGLRLEGVAESGNGRPAEAAGGPGGLAAGEPAVVVSLRSGDGLEALRQALRGAFEPGGETLQDGPMVTNQRHEALLREALGALRRAVENLDQRGAQAPEELVLADIAAARLALESVTGRRTTDDLLDAIFSRFCIGK